MKDLRAIILAAGKGTRMKSDVLKVLHPVCGKPLIDYVLDLCRVVGSLKTCVVLGHQKEKISSHLGGDFSVAVQKGLKGTADAIKSAEGYFRGYQGHVLVLCGDTPLLKKETIRDLVRKHKKSDAACTFLTAVVDDSRGYGRIIRSSLGKAAAIREERDATEFEKNIMEINVGVYCFKSKLLFQFIKEVQQNKSKNEYYLTDIVEILVERGFKMETLEVEDGREGLGVNSREDLARCEAILRERILQNLMRQGVTIVDPKTTYIDADVKIGQDTVIRPFTVIENNVRLGKRCVIGPFTRLRPGTRLADQVEIGNFAEVSRTQIGRQSIMKHFSFLGDAVVGSMVNIGAGVVTANYDGRAKNRTFIADQAFIGSDSILVAPVKIGKKALTAAGCVVTKGTKVPDGSMVRGVPGKVYSKNSLSKDQGR